MKFALIKTSGMDMPINTVSLYGAYHSTTFYPPLGLEYLGAALENEGNKAEIIDLGLESNPEDALKKSMNSTDAVGLNVYTNNYKSTADLAKRIKELKPNLLLVIGGPHCNFFQKQTLNDIPNADICVVGEGERVIVDIAKYIQGKKKLSDIHGIYYRIKNKIKSGKPLEIIDDLDSLKFPARHLVEKYNYGKVNNRYIYRPKFTSMITSRGCPYKCKFCARYGNLIKNWGFRQRSVDSVVEEILEINDKYGSVMIADDNFLANKKRATNIMDRLIESKTKIDLMIEGARVDSADRLLYEKLKKANVKFISFGIESGNQDVLDFYNKQITLDQIRKAVNLSQEMGFITTATFMLCGPIETKKHVEKTVDFACSLPLDVAIFYTFKYVYGSQLWIDAVKNKKISEDEDGIYALSNRSLGNFNEGEADEFAAEAFRRFYFRPSFFFDQVRRAFIRKDFSLIKNGLGILTSFSNLSKSSESSLKLDK